VASLWFLPVNRLICLAKNYSAKKEKRKEINIDKDLEVWNILAKLEDVVLGRIHEDVL
jgi:hypothetical protein